MERLEAAFIVPLRDEAESVHLLPRLARGLTSLEAEETRVVIAARPELSVSDIPRIRSLSQAAAAAQHTWLRALLTEERLTSVFQPIVRVADPSEVVGYEALLRGIAEDGSLVPAGVLVKSSRDAGLLTRLDVLGRLVAVRQAASYGIETLVFINFTPTAIYDPESCLRSTFQVVRQSGLEPSRIVFEVIEAEALDDLEHVRQILEVYRAEGFRVALDDIGSGYSGLTWLGALRPDFVKLDRGLVNGVTDNPFQATILAKLIELGHELGITVIAEGVERLEDFVWLRAHGAHLAQGYLFATPAAPPPPVRVPRLDGNSEG